MKIKGIVWLGTRTERFDQMTEFCRDLLGLSQRLAEPGFAVFELPNGDLFEVFGPNSTLNEFMTHPVAGFLVEDIVAARTPSWSPRVLNSSDPFRVTQTTTNGPTSAHPMALCMN